MSQTATQEDSEVDYRRNTYRPFYFPFITRTCHVSLSVPSSPSTIVH